MAKKKETGKVFPDDIVKGDIKRMKTNEKAKEDALQQQLFDIKPTVGVVATQTNEREVTVSFKIKTNKLKPEYVIDAVNHVLLAAAPEVANVLIEEISVQERIRAATRQ